VEQQKQFRRGLPFPNRSVFKHLRKKKKRSRKVTYFTEEGANIIVKAPVARTSALEQGEQAYSNPFLLLPDADDTMPFYRNGGSLSSTLTKDAFKQTLGSDPFKTGNKHYYNMLRPTIYKRRLEKVKFNKTGGSEVNILAQTLML